MYRIAHILGILLMNSCNTDIFFSNYYHLQSVRFEYNGLVVIIAKRKQRQHVKLQLNMHISIVHVLDNQADWKFDLWHHNMIFVFTSKKNVEEKPQSLQLTGTNVSIFFNINKRILTLKADVSASSLHCSQGKVSKCCEDLISIFNL